MAIVKFICMECDREIHFNRNQGIIGEVIFCLCEKCGKEIKKVLEELKKTWEEKK